MDGVRSFLAAPFISRSRLVGYDVSGWRDDAVDPLCGAVDYDTLLPLYSKGLDYRQSCSGNKDFCRAYCQSSFGNKNGWRYVWGTHVDIVIVSDTHDALVSFFD